MNWITIIFSQQETQNKYSEETYLNGDTVQPDKYVETLCDAFLFLHVVPSSALTI